MQAETTHLSGRNTADAYSDERQLGRWDFEQGGFVKIVASSDVDTEEALDMVQTLIELRRRELDRKRRQEASREKVMSEDEIHFEDCIPGMEDFLIALAKATDENGLRVMLTPRDLLPHMEEIIKLVLERRAEGEK